jgi:hypothetical protein
MTPKKKLIEVDLTLESISNAAAWGCCIEHP